MNNSYSYFKTIKTKNDELIGVDCLAAEEDLLQKKHNIKFDELH